MPSIYIVGREPAYYCRLCRKPFYEGEERSHARHVARCAEENAELIDEARRRCDPFGSADPEAEAWMRRNRDAVIRGEKRLYPSK